MSEDSITSDRELEFAKIKHKIQLCRAFSEMGYCPYGNMCMFAHGVQQLSMYQPALKVKKCRNFHSNGFCRFGQRCNFRHEKNARLKKKKNHYPDLILGVRMQLKTYQRTESQKTKNTDCSEYSLQ